jgi:hypothetical protein
VLCLQVEALRGEVARYQSRLAELENDFLSLDVVASTEVGAPAGIAQEACLHARSCSFMLHSRRRVCACVVKNA